MSLDLTKPRLRAEMEASMELVGLGLKTKSAFLEHSIAQAASVFEIVTEKANLLDRSIARYFQMRTDTERSIREVNSQFSKCGSCGNLMALKEISQENGFKTGTLNCRTCARSLNLNNLPSCPSDKTCPICGFQVVMMTGMNSGKLYPVCPFCSVNPPAEFAGKSDGVSFKCFQCSHPSCSLSGSKPSSSFSVRRCFVCKSAMFLKSYERNGISNYFLGCSKYPNCSGSVWMRFPSLEFAEASSSTCNRCSEPSLPIHLLRIKCSDPLFVNQNLESQDDFICAGGCSVSVEGFLNQSSSSSRSSSSQRSSSTRTSSRGEVARESKKNSKTSARKISTVRRNLK